MKEILLKSLCKENGCGQYGIPASAEEFDIHKTRYLRISDIDDCGNLLNSDKKSVSSPDIEKYILEEGDLVVARTGNSTGRTYYHEAKNGRLAFAGFLIKYSLDNRKVNPRYLKYFTISKKYKQWVNNLSVGSTRGNINAQTFAGCPITLPERAQQDLLVRVLSSIDAKIELNNKVNDNLEQMVKTLYDYWFVQFDFPDANGKPYKTSGGKMVYDDELKRKIPAGWKVVELREYLTSNRGVSYGGKDIIGDGVPMINLNSFNVDGTFKLEGTKSFSGEYNPSKVLKAFDLVMCNTQQTALDPQKDIIGKSFLVPDIFETEVVSTHHVTTISVKDNNLKFYLNRLFNTTYFHRYISGYATGTNILGLNFEGVLSYLTEIPNADLLSRFSDVVLNVEKQKSRIFKENHELTQLRGWLLPMLMNGQVKIC